MIDYKVLYFKLFAAYADVTYELEQQNYGAAKARLIRAQEEGEELYLKMAEDEPTTFILPEY